MEKTLGYLIGAILSALLLFLLVQHVRVGPSF